MEKWWKKRRELFDLFRRPTKRHIVSRPTAHMSDMQIKWRHLPLFFKFWIAAGGNSNFERKNVSKLRKWYGLRNHTTQLSSKRVKSGETIFARQEDVCFLTSQTHSFQRKQIIMRQNNKKSIIIEVCALRYYSDL